jgi:TM2 domain-containing membrane protein YozV
MSHTLAMSKALMKRPNEGSVVDGLIPAGASAVVPGLGQLLNGEGDKALGVFAVWAVAGAGFIGAIPLVGSLAAAVGGVTWLYAIADGYLTGRKKG